MNEILERIETVRKAKKLTVTALSELAGISSSTIYMWKKRDNVPSIEHLMLIANALDVSIEYLSTGETFSTDDANTIEKLTQKYTNELLTVGTLYLDDGKIEIPEEDRADLAIGIEAAVTAALLAYKKRKG